MTKDPTDDLRLIEDYIPIEAISAESRREKSIRKGHISTLHLWWARAAGAVTPEREREPLPPASRTMVHLEMHVVPQQLYHLTGPLMALARESGRLRLIVEAHKATGFDPQWLQNAVFEPLDEADIEVTE